MTERLHSDGERRDDEPSWTLALIRSMGDHVSSDDRSDATVLGAIKSTISAEDILRRTAEIERDRHKGFSGYVLKNSVQVPQFEQSKTGTAISELVFERASTVWVEGMAQVQTIEDANTWHSLVLTNEFDEIYKENGSNKDSNDKPFVEGNTIIEGILRVGKDDQVYLEEMATLWSNVLRSGSKNGNKAYQDRPSHELSLAESSAMRLRNAMHRRVPHLVTDFPLRKTTDELNYSPENAEKFFIGRLYELSAERPQEFPSAPSKILKLVRDTQIVPERAARTEGLSDHMMGLVEEHQLIETERKHSVRGGAREYFDAASELLMRTLDFAQKESGMNDQNARKMYQFLMDESRTRGTYKLERPSRDAIQKLASILTGTVNDILPHDMHVKPIKGDSVEGIYDAFDRILFVLNTSLSSSDHEHNDLIRHTSEVTTSLLRIGIPAIRKRGSLSSGKKVTTIEHNETT